MASDTAFRVFEILLPQISAFVSMMCSFLIIGEVIQDYKAKQSRLGAVSRSLFCMSIGDLLFSFGWFIAAWVISGEEDPDKRHLEPTSGGCKFQAFLIQFGFLASISFNGSLALIYFFMIQCNWTAHRIQRVFRPAAIVVWLISFGIALFPLFFDLYHDAGPMCWIASNDDKVDVAHLVFMLQMLPIWTVTLLLSVIMFMVYRKTKQLEKAAFDGQQQEEEVETGQEIRTIPEQHVLDDPEAQLDSESSPDQDGNGNPQMNDSSKESQTATDLEQGEGTPSNLSFLSKNNNKRSRVAAVQAMWYISSFFLSYGPATISVVVYLITGTYNVQLYRMSYFFLALQGLWNFLIFSRGRKQMKTWIGKTVKQLVWGGICCGGICCRVRIRCCIVLTPPPTFSSDPPTTSDRHNNENENNAITQPISNSRSGKKSSFFSAVSNASTVVISNSKKKGSIFSGVSRASTVEMSNRTNTTSSTRTAQTVSMSSSFSRPPGGYIGGSDPSLRWSVRSSTTKTNALPPQRRPEGDDGSDHLEYSYDLEANDHDDDASMISELSLVSLIVPPVTLDRNNMAPPQPERLPSEYELSSCDISASTMGTYHTRRTQPQQAPLSAVSEESEKNAARPQQPQRLPSECEMSCDVSAQSASTMGTVTSTARRAQPQAQLAPVSEESEKNEAPKRPQRRPSVGEKAR